MVRAETLIMVAFGLAIGTLIAIPGLAVVSYDLTGSSVPSVSLKSYGALLAVYAVLAFAASGSDALRAAHESGRGDGRTRMRRAVRASGPDPKPVDPGPCIAICPGVGDSPASVRGSQDTSAVAAFATVR